MRASEKSSIIANRKSSRVVSIYWQGKERKGKEEYLYSAFSHQGTSKALRHGSYSFTCKQHHACLSFVAFTRCHYHRNRQQTSNCSSLLIYRPRKDERLSWPSWLIYSGWLTHISGHPSATSRAQDSESTSAKDQCSMLYRWTTQPTAVGVSQTLRR